MANSGRKRNITGTAENLDKRGEGLNSGPVGNISDITGRFTAILKSLNNSTKGKNTRK